MTAEQTATAKTLDQDDTLCFATANGSAWMFTGMQQWEDTGMASAEGYIRRLVEKGEEFNRYYLINADGSPVQIGD